MTAPRSTAEERNYKRHRKQSKPADGSCAFCAIKKGDRQMVRAGKYFKVIYNIFPYSLWDGQAVADHLMLVPVQHTDTLADLSSQAAAEYVRLLGEYEGLGYNIYARAPSSAIKTVVHQHTHLIKPKGRAKRFVLLLRKPYFRVSL